MRGAIVPTAATLARYGLTEAAWLAILGRQNGVCAVCRRLPPSKRLHIDHAHVKGWERMTPEARSLRVRGLLCWQDNYTFARRGMTVERAEALTRYLQAARDRGAE